jgi:hypothetical protein
MKLALLSCAPLFVLLLVLASCDEEEGLLEPFVGCPNTLPQTGQSCPRDGLVCHYFTTCGQYFPATCGPSLTWEFSDSCMPMGGAPPNGGVGPGSSAGGSSSTGGTAGATSSAGGTGGTGGTGSGGSAGAGGF